MCLAAAPAMAIPFNLPSDEETEDNYRRLDQLLSDLYGVLRQILFRPRFVPVNNIRPTEDRGWGRGSGAVDTAPAPNGSRPEDDVRSALPDVVSSTLTPGCACACQCPSRRRPRRHRRRRRGSCCAPDILEAQNRPPGPQPLRVQPSLSIRREDNWLIIGEQLRKIAEEFRTSFNKPEELTEKEESLKMEVKTSGLFSLLVPAQFRTSLWTTVILLVGWRLLVRSR